MINYSFLSLQDNQNLQGLVIEIFNKKISLLYGDQTDALNKLIAAEDRICDILLMGKEPKGLIAYKKLLQDEYGFKDAFELKTLIVFDIGKDRGLGKYLLDRAESEAKKLNASYMYGTVAKSMPRLVTYLIRYGWMLSPVNLDSKNVKLVFKKL